MGFCSGHKAADSCQWAHQCQCREYGYLLNRTWRKRRSVWLCFARYVQQTLLAAPSLLTPGILSRLICLCLDGETSSARGRSRANICQWMWGWIMCQVEFYKCVFSQGRWIVGKGAWLLLESGDGERFLSVGCLRHVLVRVLWCLVSLRWNSDLSFVA